MVNANNEHGQPILCWQRAGFVFDNEQGFSLCGQRRKITWFIHSSVGAIIREKQVLLKNKPKN